MKNIERLGISLAYSFDWHLVSRFSIPSLLTIPGGALALWQGVFCMCISGDSRVKSSSLMPSRDCLYLVGFEP